MEQCVIGSLVAIGIMAMGFAALFLGILNLRESNHSKTSRQMFWAFFFVFTWNMGYAWMSLCHNSDFAYVPRAIALLSITLFMIAVFTYTIGITQFKSKLLYTFVGLFVVSSLTAWFFVIQKKTVTFQMTPWGYWYTSKMSFGRYLQFGSNIMGLIMFYVIVRHGLVKAKKRRSRNVYVNFMWFGPVIMAGYLLDTLIPMIFGTPAIPGSCIGAFAATIILYRVSKRNRVFGLSKTNVSQYVFEDVGVPVVITDEDGNVALANKSAEAYLQKSMQELLGMHMEDFFKLSNDEEKVYETLGTDKVCNLEQTDVKDQFQEHIYTIYFVHDVTDSRKYIELLKESREIAEEANAAKSNFLANMSHEIRTPMNAIIGMSQVILQEESVENDIKEKVGEIHTAGSNLLDIINDILDISKVEAGKYEILPDNYDLAQLIYEVNTLVISRLRETGVEYRIAVDETLPRKMVGDVGRIRQVLTNVLGNAVKFTKQGYVKLSASWNKDEVNPMIRFDIKDTGAGIKPEDIEKIFAKFGQVDNRRNKNVQGTGLGLTISKGLVELMGGDIQVDSAYGGGSTFHITIRQEIEKYEPVGEEVARSLENRTYKNEIKKTGETVASREGKRILVVDDTKINLTVAKGLLKKYGMQVDTAESGAKALQMVAENQYDLVFMDHMMPEMDGVEATKKIRELGEEYKSLPIIALTANAMNDAKVMFLQEGLQDFLAKPITVPNLDAIMEKWLPVSGE